MDFEAIADYWFGEVKTPEFPLEPIDLGVGVSDEIIRFRDPEVIEFRNPFEELPGEEPEQKPEETLVEVA